MNVILFIQNQSVLLDVLLLCLISVSLPELTSIGKDIRFNSNDQLSMYTDY